jgi:hypothetical protein
LDSDTISIPSFTIKGIAQISLQYNSIGLTQESNNFICNTTFMFSEHSDFRIQKIAFLASVKEPDGWAMPLIVKDGIDIETKYDSFHPNRIQIKIAKYI